MQTTQQILIFYPKAGNRIDYLLKEVFSKRFTNASWLVTDCRETFLSSPSFKINYSEVEVDGVNVWLFPEGWLTDGTWRSLNFASQNQGWVMFPQSKGDYTYDVFSAVFAMLSRAEEYLTTERDEHGRFSIELASYPNNMSHAIPWVDVWLTHFTEFLNEKGCELQLDTSVNGQMTVDVDNVTAVYGKPLIRQVGGAIKHAKLIGPMSRVKSAVNIEEDPFYTFPKFKTLSETYQVPFTFFLLGGDSSAFDHNQSYHSKAYKTAISELKSWATIGWHPGYFWNEKDFHTQKREKEQLEELIGEDITKSRMHFLRTDIKTTYHNLVDLGITDDYTLGFSDGVGFRAGTAFPFAYYDLLNDKTLPIRLHPFVCMDATLKWYMKQSKEEAVKLSNDIATYINSFGGELQFLWHNDTAFGFGEWNGWEKVFEAHLNLIKQCLNS